MENKEPEVQDKILPTSCEVHNTELRVCSKCVKVICTRCILLNKEEILHYKEHFEFISAPSKLVFEEFLKKIHDYEGFEILNQTYQTYLQQTEDLVDTTNEKILICKDLIISEVRKALYNYYSIVTTEFETSVKKVNNSINSLDLSDLSSKEEFKKLKKTLDDQTEFLDNEEKISLEFQKIIDGALKKIKRMKIVDYTTDNFKINLGKRGECLDLIACNGSIIETGATRGGTYWCVRSEEVFTGSFQAKIKIHKIDDTKANNYWGYAIGISRSNSTIIDNYFNDSICLQANGYLANKFTGTGSHKKLFKTNWKKGDEIVVKRDEKNDVYFGVYNENSSEMLLAFENIVGEFRIVIGFTSSSVGDKFELTEIN